MTNSTRPADRLELRQRLFLRSRGQRLALWGLILAPLVLVAAVLFLLYLKTGARLDPAAVLEALRAKIAADPFDAALNALMFAFAVLYLVYLALAQRHERLILTPIGIEYRSPLPEALRFLRPSWSLQWSQIRAAALLATAMARGAQGAVLKLDGRSRTVRLFPLQWVDPQTFRPGSLWAELRKLQAMHTPFAIEQALDDSPMLRYIAAAAPQLRIERNLKTGADGFALEKNRAALAVVVGFFVLLLYALADTFFLNPETYAVTPPLTPFLVAGGLAALAAGLWMQRGGVPAAESIAVAVLFGATVGAAAYPGALRLNALTDSDGLRTYEYQLTAQRHLEPLRAGPPALVFAGHYEYWAQFAPGSVHQFELRRGGLGFYQLNMRPLEKMLREYYEQHP